MKRTKMLLTALLLSALLAQPALAAPDKTANEQLPDQAQKVEENLDPHDSEAFKRQQAYMEKREAAKQRRDEALKIRERNAQQ